MGRLKIERGVSRIERVKLQVSVDQAIAQDIELMAKWSDNEKNYIVNELLRFALGESGDFQQYKLQVENGRSEPDAARDKAALKNSRSVSAPALGAVEAAR